MLGHSLALPVQPFPGHLRSRRPIDARHPKTLQRMREYFRTQSSCESEAHLDEIVGKEGHPGALEAHINAAPWQFLHGRVDPHLDQLPEC